jgi:adenylyltransferase/sulfurtransferase
LLQLNPHIHIDTYDYFLTMDNAHDIIAAYDIVLDCTDHFAAHFLIHDGCWYLQKPLVYAGIEQFQGVCTVFDSAQSNYPCLRCWQGEFAVRPPVANCATTGVMGILPGTIGVLQATEALKWLLGIGTLLLGRALVFNALTARFKEYQLSADSECELCVQKRPFNELRRSAMQCQTSDGTPPPNSIQEIKPIEFKEMVQQSAHLAIIDVRQYHEHAVGNLGGECIPLHELEQLLHSAIALQQPCPQLPAFDQPLVVYCQRGVRSLFAAQLLSQAGYTQIMSLQGGMDAYLATNASP